MSHQGIPVMMNLLMTNYSPSFRQNVWHHCELVNDDDFCP